jgi:hypothetical protein
MCGAKTACPLYLKKTLLGRDKYPSGGKSERPLPSQALLQDPVEPTRWFPLCALRHKRARKIPLVRTKGCLGKGKMDEVALGDATPATMRDVTHARQQFDAPFVVVVSKCEQCLTELQQQRILGI